MALTWKWEDKMGKMLIKQKTNSGKHLVNIYKANMDLGLFLNEWKDAETKEEKYQLYTFFSDMQHVKNIKKSYGHIFWDEVVSIELNLWYKEAHKLLDIFVKEGYKVKCYYKEPKKSKK